MADNDSYSVTITFPGDLEYIPAVRKFVSETLQVSDLDQKFAFRSEIIVDEICGNAVSYGCVKPDAQVELTIKVMEDRVEFRIEDEGGCRENVERLRTAVNEQRRLRESGPQVEAVTAGLGLEIVRMLSEEIDLEVDDSNLTSIRVVRRREELQSSRDSS
jgi:anti-sigma regulatory factor (Ser/Thr protein kinase)